MSKYLGLGRAIAIGGLVFGGFAGAARSQTIAAEPALAFGHASLASYELPSPIDANALTPADDSLTEIALDLPEALSSAPIVSSDVAEQADSDAPAPKAHYGLQSLKSHGGTVKWQLVGLGAAITATRINALAKHGGGLRFRNEGWFGKSTDSLGMDKVHHAYKAYVMTDVLQSIIARKTGNARGAAYSGALFGLGMMTYGEFFDGFTKGHGFSNQDMTVHLFGAGLSMLRNAVPGLNNKLDFRMLADSAFSGKGVHLKDQLADRKYLLAGKLAGFKSLENTPWRFVEVHFGYYARGFTDREIARGDPLKRTLYVGLGFNLQQLFPRKPRSRAIRWTRGALNYFQLPYTYVEIK